MENRRTIAQVNRMLRSIIEVETLEQYFWLGGRIQGFHESEFGHKYFRLLDDKSQIRCIIRKERVGKIPLAFRNGLEIDVYGDVQFYEAGGRIEINVVDARLFDAHLNSRPAIEQLRDEGLYPAQKQDPPRGFGVLA